MTRRTPPRPLSRSAAGAAIALFATDPETVARFAPKTTLDGRPDGPRRAPRQQLERETVVRPILELLAGAGIWRRRVYLGGIPLPNGQRAANPLRGMGDILALLPGHPWPRPWSIECKTLTGEQRRTQVAFQAEWERHGGLYTLARSVDDVRAVLETLRP